MSQPPGEAPLLRTPDVVVIGAGVNGLVCALILARAGLSVQVVEDKPVVGGGTRTEYPFGKAPKLAASTGSHRVGFVPEGLTRILGEALPLAPRDPSCFVPTKEAGRYLLAGAGNAGLRAGVNALAPQDATALAAMHDELDEIASDLTPAWLSGPLTVEETAHRFIRAARRQSFVALCRGTFAEYAARFGIQSGLVKATIAADSLVGSFASWDTPGSGAPLLVRHAARMTAGGGDAIAIGGLGALVRTLAEAAQRAGATISTGAQVTQVGVASNTVTGVVLANGTSIATTTVVASADPLRLRALVGADKFPQEYTRKIDAFARPGGIAKVNLALAKLPAFTCLPEDRGQHRAAILLLPGGDDEAVRAIGRAYNEAREGRLPDEQPLECIFPTAVEESLRDPDGRHHASIVVPWVPYDLVGTTWAAEEERCLKSVLAVLDAFAPGTSETVVDATVLHPKKLETHFGVTRGHVHHVDDTIVFGDRLPYMMPIAGLYACGQGCSPAGGVFAAAGHNAAHRILADLELGLERTETGRRIL
jgi:phytoene dehydrogenase-like protein